MAAPRSLLKPAFILLLIIALIVACAAGFVRWAATQSFGHRYAEAYLAKQSLRGQSLRVEGLSGDLFESFSAERLTISDKDGAWLSARDVDMSWTASQVLRGRLDIRSLVIDEASLARRPQLAPRTQGGGALKAVDVTQIAVRTLKVEPGFAGRAVNAAATGSIKLRADAGDVRLELRPRDAASSDVADVAMAWSTAAPLTGSVRASGPSGGLISGLLNLTPGLAPVIKADFTRDETSKGVSGSVAVSTDGTPLVNASGRWSKAALSASGEIRLNAFKDAAQLASRIGETVRFSVEPQDENALAIEAIAPDLTLSAALPFNHDKWKPDFKNVPVTFETRAFSQVTQQDEFDAAIVRGKGIASVSREQVRYEGNADAADARVDVASFSSLAGPVSLIWKRQDRRADFTASLSAKGIAAREPRARAFTDGDGALEARGTYDLATKTLQLRDSEARLTSGVYTARGTYQLRGPIGLEGRYDAALPSSFPAKTSSGRWWAEGSGRFNYVRLDGEAEELRAPFPDIAGKAATYDLRLRKLGKIWRLEDALVRGAGVEAKLSGQIIDGALRGKVEARLKQVLQNGARLDGVTIKADLVQTESGLDFDGLLTAETVHYRSDVLDRVTLKAKGRAQDLKQIEANIDAAANWRGAPVTLKTRATRNGANWSADRLAATRAGVVLKGNLRGREASLIDLRGDLFAVIEPSAGLPFSGTARASKATDRDPIAISVSGLLRAADQPRPVSFDAVVQTGSDHSRITIAGAATSDELSITTRAPLDVQREGRDWRIIGPLRVVAGQTIDADLDALWSGDRVRATYSATGPSSLNASGDVDMPWPLTRASVLRITSKGSGRAEALWPVFAPSGTRLSGAIAFDVAFQGPQSDLHPAGTLSLEGGSFEHIDAGLGLRDVTILATAQGRSIVFQSLSARGVRGGSLEGSGEMSLDGTQDVAIRLNGLRPLQRKDSDGVFNGTLTLERRANRTRLGGDIQVTRAALQTDRFTRGGYVTMDVRFDDTPEPERVAQNRQGFPLGLDIQLRAARQVEITGRAFETEWSGDVRLMGTLGAPLLRGEADMVRGYVDVAGRRFQFADSRVQFDGPLDAARLFLSAERDANGFTAIVRMDGALSAPEISFSSDPALPEDEVLSRVLFGQAPASLGTAGALQLAAGAAGLSTGRGFGLFDDLESALGVEDVDAGVDEDGEAFVSTGTYLADDVYADVRTNGRGVPRVSVEWTPERNIAIGTTFGAADEPRFTVKWRTDLGEKPAADEPVE